MRARSSATARRDRGGDGRLGRQRPRHLSRQSIDSTRVQGVTVRLRQLLDLRCRAWTADEPDGSGLFSAGRRASAGKPPIGCSAHRSIRSTRRFRSPASHFRVVGVSAKRGSVLGQSQDEFIVIPLGQFQMIFGSRRSLSLTRQAARPLADRRDDGRRDHRAAHRAAAEAEATRQLRPVHVRHDSRHLSLRPPTASSPCWSGSSGCRWWSAGS